MRINGGKASGLGDQEDRTAAGLLVARARSLAARRGHAQVTPLHIASAVLSASPALLLRHCCCCSVDALALCLGAALDRLAATGARAHHAPAPSNAFLAALKRTRRGWGASNAGAAGEVERLVASVLVDPGVGRAVRDAAAAESRRSTRRLQGAGPPDPAVPNNVDLIRVGSARQQPSSAPGNAYWGLLLPIPDGSEGPPRQAKSSGTAGQAILAAKAVATPTTATLPPWLRRCHDTLLSRSTHRGGTTNLQTHPMQSALQKPKFTELTAQNLKTLCAALELRVPWAWHESIVPGISSVVLRCRSGMIMRRARTSKPTSSSSVAMATWLLFRGINHGSGYLVARELARLVFGSYSEFTALQVLGNSDIITTTCRGKPLGTFKRQRTLDNDGGGGYVGERLFEAIRENPHRVILINGVDRLDRDSEARVKNAVKEGTMRGCNSEAVSLEDVIVVLMISEVVGSGSVISSPRRVKCPRIGMQSREEGDVMGREVRSRRFSFDLNASAEDGKEEQDDLADEEEAGIEDVVDGVFFFN